MGLRNLTRQETHDSQKSSVSEHSRNLRADSRAALLVTQLYPGGDALGASRVTLTGDIRPIAAPEVAEARQLYLARYGNSQYWVDFEDSSFYRMNVADVSRCR